MAEHLFAFFFGASISIEGIIMLVYLRTKFRKEIKDMRSGKS